MLRYAGWLPASSALLALWLTGATAADVGGAPNATVGASDPIPMDFPAIARAPQGAPNILLVLTDDVGFGAPSAFGGPVPTPTLERLAAGGLKYNRFHTTAMCSPTRAALLTGRNHHAVATGSLTDFPMGAPGYTGMIPRSAATIAEVLRRNGYNTAAFGKHHNVPHGPFGGAGPNDYLPNSLGFEYFFGFIGSDTDQWRPTLYRNTTRVIDTGPQPILDQRLADDAIGWLHRQQAAAPGKPFFVYYAPGSAHTPHQAPADWIEKFRGRFAGGWEQAREQTLARQKALGVVPETTKLPAWPADLPRWNTLPPQERAYQGRAMEVFAAQLAFQDAQFGRIVDELERMGLRENTLIVFIAGDNGPDAAASPAGAIAEAGELANRRLTPEEHWQLIDQLGGPLVHSNYGSAWAQAMATPFPFYKQIASHLGGVRNGMVISWPRRIAAPGIRTQYAHVIDIHPTLLAAAGIAAPDVVDGVAQQPVDGIDLAYSFDAPQAPSRRTVQYYELLGNRAIYADGWLAATTPQRRPWRMANPEAAINKAPGYAWELYDLSRDFSQSRDLAARHPRRLADLRRQFDEQAARYGIAPINDRTDFERTGSAARAYIAPRQRYEYWGPGLTVFSDAAPALANRAFTITADLSAGEGVIAAAGSRLGGWSFGIQDGRPAVHHALTVMPADRFELVAPEALESGRAARVAFDFDYDGGGLGKGGLVSISIDGRKVAQARIERTIVTPDPHSESFDVGLDSGVPVVETPGRSNAFGGELKKVTIDVGQPGRRRAPPG
ncbi:MAG: arylsulfatase [Gammaproteobacteria bacterium]